MRKPPSPRRSADDRLFRLGTGFFAFLVVLLVGGIAFELYENSRLSIQKFGFHFWQTTTWDPVAGASHFDPHRARHRDLPLRAFASLPEDTARLSDRSSRGHSLHRLRSLGHFRAGADRAADRSPHSRLVEGGPAVYGATARSRDARRRAHSRRDGDSVHLFRGA